MQWEESGVQVKIDSSKACVYVSYYSTQANTVLHQARLTAV